MANSSDAWVDNTARSFAASEAVRDPEALVVVVGPTASGKTELAIQLAELLDGEIVNVDSVQIYRRFDIGSGKPTPRERGRAVHHLVDAFDPLDAIEAARFRELADRAIGDIRARGKRAILCGGTFLWHRAVLFGLADAPPANVEVRTRHRARAEIEGRAALHAALAAVDPASAARLHPNDFVRVSRALEVFELSGKTMSEIQDAHGFKEARYRSTLVGIRHDEPTLSARIERRAHHWLEHGWLDEVEALLRDGYGQARALDSVGYREVAAYLRGEVPRSELLPKIVQSTRIFVRRQRTWLAHEAVTWLDPPRDAV